MVDKSFTRHCFLGGYVMGVGLVNQSWEFLVEWAAPSTGDRVLQLVAEWTGIWPKIFYSVQIRWLYNYRNDHYFGYSYVYIYNVHTFSGCTYMHTFILMHETNKQRNKEINRQTDKQTNNQRTNEPTNQRTNEPTNQPSNQPTNQPSNQATNQPTNQPNQPNQQEEAKQSTAKQSKATSSSAEPPISDDEVFCQNTHCRVCLWPSTALYGDPLASKSSLMSPIMVWLQKENLSYKDKLSTKEVGHSNLQMVKPSSESFHFGGALKWWNNLRGDHRIRGKMLHWLKTSSTSFMNNFFCLMNLQRKNDENLPCEKGADCEFSAMAIYFTTTSAHQHTPHHPNLILLEFPAGPWSFWGR